MLEGKTLWNNKASLSPNIGVWSVEIKTNINQTLFIFNLVDISERSIGEKWQQLPANK